MNADAQILCSFALTFGVPIMFALRELRNLGPSPRHLPPGDETVREPTPLPDAGVSPRVQKPLPDCLIPKPVPARVPELV